MRDADDVVEGVVPPSGTVTFLFTDIEGSTRLWEEHPEEMRVAVERHDQILGEVIESHGGYVFTTAGDSFAVAFTRVGDALAAAAQGQAALGAEDWPTSTPIRVRMGVHCGEAHERDADYFGPAPNRAARLMAAGHGGQILVSAAAAALLDGDGLTELGEYRLKDLQTPQAIWQVGSARFPPLNTLDSVRHNLPVRREPLVGRTEELAVVAASLAEHRLVTLTGMGGTGKTTLAVAVAAETADRFPDGVFLAELAPHSDERLIGRVVGEAAGMRLEGMDQDEVHDAVTSFLAGRRCLLVVDNCEHLLDAAAEVVDELLTAGERCRVLATSREALDVAGEHSIRVGPLPTSVAMSLLVDRTRALRSDFRPSDDDEVALEEICRHLDGIPLAVELAAAQLAHLSPTDLAARLDDRFAILAGGRRAGRSRRRTLASMMDWSWDLLQPHQQQMLAELAVFVGGWNLEAAEAVCTVDAVAVPATLGDLYARSLLTRTDGVGGVRYGMLETVRLYAMDRLRASGRLEEMRDRHAAFWSDTALPASFEERAVYRDAATHMRLVPEAENARAAASWLLAQGRATEVVPMMTVFGLVTQLARVASSPVRDLLPDVLDSDLPDRLRAHALLADAHMAWTAGNFVRLDHDATQAYELAVATGDDSAASVASSLRTFRLQLRQPQQAIELAEQSIQHAQVANEPRLERCARGFGSIIHSFGLNDPEQGIAICEEVLQDADPRGYDRVVALTSLIAPLYLLGRWAQAAAISDQATKIMFVDDGRTPFWEVVERAIVTHELGEDPQALYDQAWQHNVADGTSTTRPEHLLLPLSRAARHHRWPDAASIIELIRELSRSGIEFETPAMVAIYLHYRNRIRDAGALSAAVRAAKFDRVVADELARAQD